MIPVRKSHAPKSEKARQRYERVSRWIWEQGACRGNFTGNVGEVLTDAQIQRVAQILSKIRRSDRNG
jgi:hypothetical protein